MPLPFTIRIIFSIVSWYCIDLGSIFVSYVYRNQYRYWYCEYYSWYCIDYSSSLISVLVPLVFTYVFRFWFRVWSWFRIRCILILCTVYLDTGYRGISVFVPWFDRDLLNLIHSHIYIWLRGQVPCKTAIYRIEIIIITVHCYYEYLIYPNTLLRIMVSGW